MLTLFIPEDESMSEPLSSIRVMRHGDRLKIAVLGAVSATKHHPQYVYERFIEALHANGFQVTEIEEVKHTSSEIGHG